MSEGGRVATEEVVAAHARLRAVRLAVPLPFEVALPHGQPGRTVRLCGPRGRIALARVSRREVAPITPEGTVGVDAQMQHQLRVLPGDIVSVTDVALPPATRVRLVPAFRTRVDDALRAAVRTALVGAKAPVWPGQRLRIALGERSGSGIFEVVEVLSPSGPEALVGPDTAVAVTTPTPSELPRFADDLTLADVAGLDDVVARLRQMLEAPLLRPERYADLGIMPPRGILLHGPPGVGKTFTARALAHDLGVSLVYLSASEIVGSSYGKTESNLREVFEVAARSTPALILIDEIDALVPSRRHLSTQTDYRMVTHVLGALDGMKRLDGVVVLATTNRPGNLDPALRRPGRFDTELFIPPPATEARLAILRLCFERMPITEALRARLPQLAEETHGYVPADLASLARQAGLHAVDRSGPPDGGAGCGIVVDLEDALHAAGEVGPSLLRGSAVRAPAHGLEVVIDHAGLLGRLRRVADAPPATRPRRLLFTGPTGSGKSTCAAALAKDLGAHLLELTPADLFTSWLGETEEALRSAFELAALVPPIVLVLDNLDGIAPRRDAGGRSGAVVHRVVDQLLHEMDRLSEAVLLIGITRHEDLVEPAVRRRFEERVEFRLPDGGRSARSAP